MAVGRSELRSFVVARLGVNGFFNVSVYWVLGYRMAVGRNELRSFRSPTGLSGTSQFMM